MKTWPVIFPRYKVGHENERALTRNFKTFVRHDDVEHVVLGRAMVHAIRNMDIHVSIVPYDKPPEGLPWGSAHSKKVGEATFERHIEIFTNVNRLEFFHVILHEWVHHMLGHCDVWTSTPTFVTEYTTEQEVLRIAYSLVSQPLYEKMTQWAKNNVRMHYFDSYQHGDPGIRAWCEYEGPDEVQKEAEWNRTAETSSTFTDQSQLPF